jgi:hypothetical protein
MAVPSSATFTVHLDDSRAVTPPDPAKSAAENLQAFLAGCGLIEVRAAFSGGLRFRLVRSDVRAPDGLRARMKIVSESGISFTTLLKLIKSFLTDRAIQVEFAVKFNETPPK